MRSNVKVMTRPNMINKSNVSVVFHQILSSWFLKFVCVQIVLLTYLYEGAEAPK